MIICGNIYLDELNKTFVLECLICEKKSKAYTDFTKHIRKKHKTLEGRDQQLHTSPIPNIIKKESEDEELAPENDDEEKPLIQIKHEMEMEILDDMTAGLQYSVLDTEEVSLAEYGILHTPRFYIAFNSGNSYC